MYWYVQVRRCTGWTLYKTFTEYYQTLYKCVVVLVDHYTRYPPNIIRHRTSVSLYWWTIIQDIHRILSDTVQVCRCTGGPLHKISTEYYKTPYKCVVVLVDHYTKYPPNIIRHCTSASLYWWTITPDIHWILSDTVQVRRCTGGPLYKTFTEYYKTLYKCVVVLVDHYTRHS